MIIGTRVVLTVAGSLPTNRFLTVSVRATLKWNHGGIRAAGISLQIRNLVDHVEAGITPEITLEKVDVVNAGSEQKK